MARPKKDPQVLKQELLRVPVSEAEKSYITEAAISTDGEFAKWARAILLKAAGDWHAIQGGRSRKPKRMNGTEREKAATGP